LFAEVTFTLAGGIGLVAVHTKRGGNLTLVECKTHYQPAFAEGLRQHEHQQ